MKYDNYKSRYDRESSEELSLDVRLDAMENKIDGIISRMETFEKILKAHSDSIYNVQEILKQMGYIKDEKPQEEAEMELE